MGKTVVFRIGASMITYYCDGACKGNPGKGGWGFVVTMDSVEYGEEVYGPGKEQDTNNSMELEAAIRALGHFEEILIECDFDSRLKATFICDSKYVLDGLGKWMHGWKQKGWRTSTGAVKNLEKWKRLDELNTRLYDRISWKWVKGHNGDIGNERADAAANKGAELQQDIDHVQTTINDW